MPWRRKWQLTPVFLPGKSHGKRAWWATVHGVSKSWTKLSDWACTWGTWMYVPLIQVMSKLGLEYNMFEFYKNIVLWIIVFLFFFFFENNSILNFNKNPGLDRCVVEFSWIWISLVLWLPKIYWHAVLCIWCWMILQYSFRSLHLPLLKQRYVN